MHVRSTATTTTQTTTTTTPTNNNNHTNNNNNNNDSDNNKNSRESGLNSLDLDDDNPESSLSGSESDLDKTSLVSFNPAMGVESSLGSLGQQEADLSLDNLGHQMMTIGSSLGSLDQKNGQEGMTIGTTWEPSLEQTKESFDRPKPKKRVTFSSIPTHKDKLLCKDDVLFAEAGFSLLLC